MTAMVQGLMQHAPLLISGLLDNAAHWHSDAEIVSREADGSEHRTGCGAAAVRAKRLATALQHLGVVSGDRVATLAMNNHRHFELYFGVSGFGAVLHTVNPRLFDPQIEYIMAHGGSRLLFVDPQFLPRVLLLAPKLAYLRHTIVMGGPDALGKGDSLPGLIDYETFIASGTDDYNWAVMDERAASTLCYTSGKTGNPIGVMYSHRSTVLHALSACQPESFGISAHSVLLALPPMFHANAWRFPYLSAMVGAKLLLPGLRLDGESIADLIASEGATFTVGVPTVFTMLLGHLARTGQRIPTLRKVGIGGSAIPKAMTDDFARHGCQAPQFWGMTETSPLGTIATDTPAVSRLEEAERSTILAQQGRVRWGVDARILGEDGHELPRDGRSQGALWVRGRWVAKGYFVLEGDATDTDG